MNATQQAILEQANLAMVDAYIQDGTLGDTEADMLMQALIAKNARKVKGMTKALYVAWGVGLYCLLGLIWGFDAGVGGLIAGLLIAAALTTDETKMLQLRSMVARDLGEACARARALGF